MNEKKDAVESRLNRFREFAERGYGGMRQVAEMLGKSPSYFSNYVYRQTLPGFNVLIELQSLGLDIYWLYTGEKYNAGRRPDGLDIETERAYLLQERFVRTTATGEHEAERQRTTSGDTMESLSIAEVWDKLSAQFPGTPLWEQLTEAQKRDYLYGMAQNILTMQHQAGRTTTEEDS